MTVVIPAEQKLVLHVPHPGVLVVMEKQGAHGGGARLAGRYGQLLEVRPQALSQLNHSGQYLLHLLDNSKLRYESYISLNKKLTYYD